MRILIIASTPSSIISFRGRLIQEFNNRGYKVHLTAPFVESDSPIMRDLKEIFNVEIHPIALKKANIGFFSDLIYLLRLIRLIKEIKPQFVFQYTLKPIIYGSIASYLSRVPKCFSMLSGLGFLFISNTKNPLKKLIKYIGRFLLFIALRNNSKIFFQNNDDRQDLIRKKIINNQDTCLINGSGVDLNYYQFSELPNNASFLLIARMIKSKGIIEYIDAIRIVKNKYPETIFTLVGGVEENIDAIGREDINGWINEGLIEYKGELKDVRPVIKDCSVYVLPSYREGTPRSVLEAMSMGRPIITTDAPGCKETVINEVTGFIVKVRDPILLANAMERMIEDPNLRKELGRNSRIYAEKKYDDNLVSKKIVKEIEMNLS